MLIIIIIIICLYFYISFLHIDCTNDQTDTFTDELDNVVDVELSKAWSKESVGRIDYVSHNSFVVVFFFFFPFHKLA